MSTTVDVIFSGGMKVDAQIGDVLIKTDQPAKDGGEDSAPEPSKLFLASIATCAGLYALRFCQTRKLPTEGLAFTMRCEQDPKTKLYSKMVLELTLPPDFPEKYKKAVTRAAESCFIKKHFSNPPQFETVLM